MKTQAFKSITGLELIINSKRSSIVFEVSKEQDTNKQSLSFNFSEDTYKEFVTYLETRALELWPNLVPKEARGPGADYYEYYDKELDNNGYLSIINHLIDVDRPSLDSLVLYRFNKAKMESFIFDLKKNV